MGCRASDVVMWTIEVDEKRDWGKKEQHGDMGLQEGKAKKRGNRGPASHSHALGGSGGPSPVKRSPERLSSQSRDTSCSRTVRAPTVHPPHHEPRAHSHPSSDLMRVTTPTTPTHAASKCQGILVYYFLRSGMFRYFRFSESKITVQSTARKSLLASRGQGFYCCMYAEQ